LSDINIDEKTIAQALSDPNFSFLETFADATDSAKITREMTVLVFRLRQKREQLKRKERDRVVLDKKYNDKRRQAYLANSNAPNEKNKSILVEIATEEEAYNLAITEQQVKELSRDLSTIKTEIDTLKAISYNLRTEMGAF